MYEYTPNGLGWETIFETNWLGGRTDTPMVCMELVHRGVSASEAEQRCFKETTAERQLAEQAGCVRIGNACESDGYQGSSWCCPRGFPDGQIPEGIIIPGDPDITEISPPSSDPNPISQHTFLSKLSHPGAIAAIGVLGIVAYLGYRLIAAEEERLAAEEFADVRNL